MRSIVVLGAVAASLVLGAAEASAMGGSGNLSPTASPYAILVPQTVAPAIEGRSSLDAIGDESKDAAPPRTKLQPRKDRSYYSPDR